MVNAPIVSARLMMQERLKSSRQQQPTIPHKGTYLTKALVYALNRHIQKESYFIQHPNSYFVQKGSWNGAEHHMEASGDKQHLPLPSCQFQNKTNTL